jgi:hypothetical protein
MVLLKEAGADASIAPASQSFTEPNIVAAILLSVARLVVNRFKKAWSFSEKELSFVAAAFKHLTNTLRRLERPSDQELQDLRGDLLLCQWIVERRLIGVAELRRAADIEHFNQSDYVEHVTLEQMGVRASLNGKRSRKLVSS